MMTMPVSSCGGAHLGSARKRAYAPGDGRPETSTTTGSWLATTVQARNLQSGNSSPGNLSAYQVFFEEMLWLQSPKFRIDVNVHSLLMNSAESKELPVNRGLTLPEPTYPRFPEKLSDPGP